MARRTFTGRKLLVATIGAASVTYVACSTSSSTVGNLMGGGIDDGGSIGDATQQDEFIVGNLMPIPNDSGLMAEVGSVGNLMPPHFDAGPDATTDAAADATTDAPADASADAPAGD